MAQVKVGDHVRIADREPDANDSKNGLFYEYFRNLMGVIERVYEDNTVCIDVNIDTLPEDVRARHKDMELAARDKWIDGLSQEQRTRLTEKDKQFKMSYKVVVSAGDVNPSGKDPKKPSTKTTEKAPAKTAESKSTPAEPEKAGPKAAKSAAPEAAPPAKRQASAKAPAAKPKASAVKAETAAPARKTQASPKGEDPDTPKRVTAKDLAAAERDYLESLKASRPNE